VRNYYQLLSIDLDASPEDVEKAFRREIARYQLDKVQHLGQEFQAMAATLAAALTDAHRVLMDPDLRARYDEDLRAGRAAPEPPALQWATTPPPHRPAAPQPPSPPSTSEDRPGPARQGQSAAGPDSVKGE
jgi:curved DNA-binding protein CbpA